MHSALCWSLGLCVCVWGAGIVGGETTVARPVEARHGSPTKTQRQEGARPAWGAAVPSAAPPTPGSQLGPTGLLWTEERCAGDMVARAAPLDWSLGSWGASQALPFFAGL